MYPYRLTKGCFVSVPAPQLPSDKDPKARLIGMMDLDDLSRLFWRRRKLFLGVFGTFLVFGSVLAFAMPTRYRAEALLMLAPITPSIDEKNKETLALQIRDEKMLHNEMNVMMSPTVAQRVVKELGLDNDPDFLGWQERWLAKLPWIGTDRRDGEHSPQDENAIVDAVRAGAKIRNDGRSFTIRLTYTSKDPEKAARIANAFAKAYLDVQMDAQYETMRRSNEWLGERLDDLHKKLQDSEQAVEAFRQKEGLLDIDGETSNQQTLRAVNTQLIEARARTAAAEARLRGAQGGGSLSSSGDVLSSPIIQSLHERESAYKRELAELSKQYGEKHPSILKARSSLDEVQGQIARAEREVLSSLQQEVAVARGIESQLETDMKKLEGNSANESQSTVILRQLQREAQANRELYETFLNRSRLLGQEEKLQTSAARLISQADVPMQPFFPKKWVFLAVFSGLGLIFGALACYLREGMDRKVRSVEQLTEAFDVSVLGLLPSLTGSTDRSPQEHVLLKPHSLFCEVLRTIRTTLQLNRKEKKPRVMLVTSSVAGEGKTSFCLAYARLLAQSGLNVLLIDADTRRPRVASALGIKAAKGLRDVLAETVALKEVVQKDAQTGKLDILPSAGKVTNAQELLGSERMAKLVKECAATYDLVLIDTPPILAVSDALVLMPLAEIALLLVRWGQTSLDMLQVSLERLQAVHAPLAGVVLSQVDPSKIPDIGKEDAA